ncbi:hypothetical protein ABZR88_03085 [Mucilaginibacter yixingensis]|nr:hypothetical protein [Mucilaginibacter yixingensis]
MLTCLITACKQKSTPVRLTLSKDRKSITVSGLSEIELNGIARDSMPMEAWQSLLAVTKSDTADTASFEPVLIGRYSIANHLIIFTPDSGFKKDVHYNARFYLLNEDDGPLDMVFKHRKLGQPAYIEMRF